MIIKTNSAKHKLQIIATPIGNLEEISTRALDALVNADIIFCEDTRVSGKLLSHYEIKNKHLESFQKFNENEKASHAIECIKQHKCVLISDAGYPCLSDPGFNLVQCCYQNDIAVEVINGPSSLIHAAVMSGVNLNNFYFNGFLNVNKTQRKNKLKELIDIKAPIIFFESVHRIKETLLDIEKIFDSPDFTVCRELTKINETIYKGKLSEIINSITLKGEFVIIVSKKLVVKEKITDKQIISEVTKFIKEDNCKIKDACKMVADKHGLQANYIYNLYIK